jgi:hypothetical protein
MFINPGSRIRLNPNPGRFQIDPWSVMGQTTINHGVSIDNPTPNAQGMVGEIATLPYTVPVGKVLLINSMYMEGNWTSAGPSNSGTDVHNSGVQAVWLGASVVTNSQFIVSNAAVNASNQLDGIRCYIPAGKIVNVRITSSLLTVDGWVAGWGVFGYLLSPNAVPLFGI